MKGKTVRFVSRADEYKHQLAADFKFAQAAERRQLAEYRQSWAREDGVDEVDTTDDFAEAERREAEARRHLRSAWMIRRHFNEAKAPSAPPCDTARPTAVATPRERRERRTSSPTRAGPDDEGESPAPPSRRLCAFCGKNIPADRGPKATHCTDKHAANDRKRRQRERDRARSKLPPTPMPADFWRMLEITDEERDWLRALVACRCNGRHLEFDPGECFRCGHRLPRDQVAA